MKNFRKKGLAWLLAAVLVLPGTPVMAEEAAEPAETEQPAEPDRTEEARKEPVTIVAWWTGSSEDGGEEAGEPMDAEGESGDPDEYDAEEGSSPADPEENGTDGTGTFTDPGEDGTDSGEEPLDAGTEDESTGDGTEGADPGSDGADEPENLSDGVSAAAEQNNAGRTVVVTSSLDGLDEVEENTEAVLTAVFYGFSDEDEYTIQWQYSPDGGATVYDAEDGTGPEYRYVVTEETIRYSWRVVVTLEAGEETLPEPAEDGALQE